MSDTGKTLRADRPGSLLQMKVFLGLPRPFQKPADGTLSAVTSTLVYGRRDAVLVDAQHIQEDVDKLADVIERTDRRLTTIFITHGHPDHYFGAARLAKRFPGVEVTATARVVDYIAEHVQDHVRLWEELYGDFARPDLLPSPLTSDTILLEERALRVIEIGQGDIAPSTVLQVAELGALVVGDVAYNQIHQNVGLSSVAEWQEWIASVDKLELLRPRSVVAGHKKPGASDEEVARILGGTRSYIRDFEEVASTSASAHEIIEAMTIRYPDHGNVNAFVRSANAVMKRSAQGSSPRAAS